MPWWGVAAIVLGFFVVFPLWWCFIVWMIGSGWRAIARACPETAAPPADARVFVMQTGNVGARYGKSLTVSVTRSHLHLKPLAVFAVGHPPIAIPWERIREVSQSGLFRGFSLCTARLVMPDGKERTIRLPRQVFEASPLKIRE